MNTLLLLGLLGVGGYVLLSSSSASTSTSPGGAALPPSPGVAAAPSVPSDAWGLGTPPPSLTPAQIAASQANSIAAGCGPNGIVVDGQCMGTGLVNGSVGGVFGERRWDPLSRRWY
jgi:hypothetical protein